MATPCAHECVRGPVRKRQRGGRSTQPLDVMRISDEKLRETLSVWVVVGSTAFLIVWSFVPIGWTGWIIGFGVALGLMIAAYLISPVESRLRTMFLRRAEIADPSHEAKLNERGGKGKAHDI